MTIYSTLKTLEPTYDPIHTRIETKTTKFDALDKTGKAIRFITREGGVVRVECARSGRAIEIPWSACIMGVILEEDPPAKRGTK